MALIPSCPTNCSADQPVFLMATCAKDVEAQLGRIDKFYFTAAGFPLSAVGDLVGSRLSNTNNNPNDIRFINVIGSMSAPASSYITLPLGMERLQRKVHTINFKMYDISDTNNESMRLLQCGADGLYIGWFEDQNSNQFGGLAGLTLKTFRVDLIIPEGDDLQYWDITVTYESPYAPERYNTVLTS